MPADQEPTAWELMRILQTVQDTLGRMEGRMLTQDAFRTYQEANERRFMTVERTQNDWTVESRGAHVALDGKIDRVSVDMRALLDTYREKQEAVEREQRSAKSRNWFAIGLAAFGAILGFGLNIVSRGVGG